VRIDETTARVKGEAILETGDELKGRVKMLVFLVEDRRSRGSIGVVNQSGVALLVQGTKAESLDCC
jgi:hypothetical protein